MEGNNLVKKGVAVAVILLFIGLAFAPSINANISKASVASELVEITTEVCSFPDENADTYKFCFIISGDVEHRNFNGTFYLDNVTLQIASMDFHF